MGIYPQQKGPERSESLYLTTHKTLYQREREQINDLQLQGPEVTQRATQRIFFSCVNI